MVLSRGFRARWLPRRENVPAPTTGGGVEVGRLHKERLCVWGSEPRLRAILETAP
jgi:hypothetical protein